MASELWIARENLSVSGAGGHIKNLSDANAPLRSWSNYCEDIGVSKSTAKARQGTRTDIVANLPPSKKGKSRDEAAKDTGETESTVRHRIQRGNQELAQGGPQTLTQSDQQYIIKQAKNIKVVQGEPQTLTQSDQQYIIKQAKKTSWPSRPRNFNSI